MAKRWLLLAAKSALLAAIYVALARWGLQLDPVGRFATFVWPPSGLSLAALLLFGSELWPGVAIGAAMANILTGAPIPVACGIALGNTLEAVLGSYALNSIPGFRLPLDRVRDVIGLIVLAAIASTVVSATIGVVSLYAGGLVPGPRLAETWVAWWQGDVLGDLVVAPFLLSWMTVVSYRVSTHRLAEACALGAALFVGSVLLLDGSPAGATGFAAFRQPTTLLPLLIWAALRFGIRGATGATLLVSAVAVWTTAHGRGPFARDQLHESLALLQAFMGVVAITFLVLAAVTAERQRVDGERNLLFHRERLARAYLEEIERSRRS